LKAISSTGRARLLRISTELFRPPQSELAQQIIKDPYNFDFLSLGSEAKERDLERGLIAQLQKFLLELGVGFAFVGSQYPLEVDGEDFFIDLLFYHLKLRCFVVIDLKMDQFRPEYAGKMNFYLSAVDDLLKHSSDQPSLGIILCKTKRRWSSSMRCATPQNLSVLQSIGFTAALPERLKGNLPSIEDLEAELSETDNLEDYDEYRLSGH